jgi:hypothetical protein
LRPGTLVPMNIEVPTKYPLSQDRIVVFENCLHSKSSVLYRPGLHGNWNALSIARRALKDKFPTPTVPLTAVLHNHCVFLPDPVLSFFTGRYKYVAMHSSCYFSHFCVSILQIKTKQNPYLCLINLLHGSAYMGHYQVVSSSKIRSSLTFNSVCTNKTFKNNAKMACDFI